MGIKVIDNKKVDITDSEYAEYKKICVAYDRPNFKGEDLFRDRFVTDDAGKIIYVKSTGNRYVSFEVLFFLFNLMQNQHIRFIYKEVGTIVDKLNLKYMQLLEKEKEIDKMMARLKTVEQNNTER